jgi:hypothetical protein
LNAKWNLWAKTLSKNKNIYKCQIMKYQLCIQYSIYARSTWDLIFFLFNKSQILIYWRILQLLLKKIKKAVEIIFPICMKRNQGHIQLVCQIVIRSFSLKKNDVYLFETKKSETNIFYRGFLKFCSWLKVKTPKGRHFKIKSAARAPSSISRLSFIFYAQLHC